MLGPNVSEGAMSRENDFDFDAKRGLYRGRGTAALIALAIFRLPRAAALALALFAWTATPQPTPRIFRLVLTFLGF